ncbi:MAG TPA: hypothetical protein VFJ61_06875 [Solirubrobacterales bacterium]|nr:hypothetical protein [Solirubrobacterales bacterium]
MTTRLSIARRLALLPLALLFLLPAAASAADPYEASWNGGHITATANADFTAAMIESVSVSFEECGTATGETSCTWEARFSLHSDPATRCNPATPEDQVVWSSGTQSGNGTVTDSAKSFPLEGCRGQSLSMVEEFHKTYDETAGPLRITGGSTGGHLFSFGYHPGEEEERRIVNANPPAAPLPPFVPNFSPAPFLVASDCHSLTIDRQRFVFSFARLGCGKATGLAQKRYYNGTAPSGYACRRRAGGVLCWRSGRPEKRLEWRLPGTKPAPQDLSRR